MGAATEPGFPSPPEREGIALVNGMAISQGGLRWPA